MCAQGELPQKLIVMDRVSQKSILHSQAAKTLIQWPSKRWCPISAGEIMDHHATQLPETSAAQMWANAFRAAFEGLPQDWLDGVQFRSALTLGPEFVAAIYDDRFGVLTGRIFEVAMLQATCPEPFSAVDVAMSYVTGSCIEPTEPGHLLGHPLLMEANTQFPGIRWWGDIYLEPRTG